MRLIGHNGAQLIQSYEKLSLVAFKPVKNDPWTIGWGRAYGVKQGDTCTPQQAAQWFQDDLVWVEKALTMVIVPLTQNQFDALCSFIYNIGSTDFMNSTLLRLLNLGQYWRVPSELQRWNRKDGVVVQGLVNRRQAEIELWCRHDAYV